MKYTYFLPWRSYKSDRKIKRNEIAFIRFQSNTDNRTAVVNAHPRVNVTLQWRKQETP